ncbi:hypothetical protein C3E79_03195 [Corynebacterium liangguodongii]|uniref:Uncharacterized protein n=2 Tax=Corynebacterium liangguodongii TaxID=2079535 RepID=A0A2S0WH15_9CORY|nr:hypothetical protein C3E79_03195 [Corynebacterium liangguodongii]PWB99580.1 hypothetical protein DF219_06600 [Corynebacterium liangguodongii]
MSVMYSALGEMSEGELRRIIAHRPDVAYPTPPSLAALATRLALPGSIARVLRTLTAAEIAVLEVLGDYGAELEPVALERVDLPVDLPRCAARLRDRALIVGPDDALRLAPGALSALPPGWRILDPAPEGLAEVLAGLGQRERSVLETLASAGSIGTSRAAAPDADPELPVPRLISRGLLVRVNSQTVRLPRPVREALRGGTPRSYPLSPRPAGEAVEPSLVSSSSAAAGLDAVRQVRGVITRLIGAPIALLKDGSLGVRATAALGKELGFDPALAVTVAESAGLIGRGDIDAADCLAATREGLAWLDAPLYQQWAVVLCGWFASPWRTELDRKLLSEEMRAPEIRWERRGVVTQLREGPLDREDLGANLHHFAPLMASGLSYALIDKVVEEGHAIGALAHDMVSPPARALLDGADIAAATREMVPAEVDYVIAQADMTILAPGPLAPEVATTLEAFADLESPGIASLYRVTDASIKRALDAGRTAEELQAWLERHCAGEVPQAMRFAITDAARHHGALRAGAAMSYLRSRDEALLAAAASEVEGLRVIAPTVAVSDASVSQLVAQLRAAGFHPAAEDASGATLNTHEDPLLVAPTPSSLPKERAVDEAQLDRVVATLRSTSADEGAGEGEGEEGFFATLQSAARSRRHVTIGYVDKDGRGRLMTVLPLTVGAGRLDALDEATDRVVRVELPRITRVVVA